MNRSGNDHFLGSLERGGEKAEANLECGIKIVFVLQSESNFKVLNIPKGSTRKIRPFRLVAAVSSLERKLITELPRKQNSSSGLGKPWLEIRPLTF